MKILALTLFLYFSLFTSHIIYAGNTTMVSNYPAPSGSYNKVVITPQAGPAPTNVDCTVPSNAGLLFLYTDTSSGKQSLEICANNGNPIVVPYPETCFNRFCSCPGPYCVGSSCTFNGCPTGYTQATSIVDNFTTSSTPTVTVYSTVCCSAPSIGGVVTPSTVHP
jgi:hypothetical protein